MKSDSESPFLIKPLPGFTTLIGQLVSMMNYARMTTLDAVAGLGRADLDWLLDDQANSIGMLLEHVACVEEGYQANTFGWTIEGERYERWKLGSDLGEEGRRLIRGRDLDYYEQRLAGVRSRTLQEFARRDDDWLLEESDFWGGRKGNNYFKWFHVFEDELSHRGQIRLIRRRVPRA